MSDFIGASLSDLEALAATFESASGRLGELRREVDGRVGSVAWRGADYFRFKTEWDAQSQSQLAAVAELFDHMRTSVLGHRDEQRQVSSVDGGGGTGGPVFLGPPIPPGLAGQIAVNTAIGALNDIFDGWGGPDFPPNPSGEPHVVSSQTWTLTGEAAISLGVDLGQGFRVETLSDGTVRVTEFLDGGLSVGVGAGADASGSWGEHTARVGAAADATGRAGATTGGSYVVADMDAAKTHILSRLASIYGGPLANDVGAAATGVANSIPGINRIPGLDTVYDSTHYDVPKRESSFFGVSQGISGSARLGAAVGGETAASLEYASQLQLNRDGTRSFQFAATASGSRDLEKLGLPLPGNDISARGSLQPSVTVDRFGRPIAATVVVEYGSGDTMHRQTVTADLAQMQKAQADAIVRGLASPTKIGDVARDLIHDTTGSVSHIDETWTVGSKAYGGTLNAEALVKVTGGVEFNIQTEELGSRTVSGGGGRP